MTDSFECFLENEAATQAFAKRLATVSQSPLLIYFYGEIGSGKTTFIRAFLRAFGVTGRIKSPTFTLVEVYPVEQQTFVHVDLYRLAVAEEFLYIGLDEYLTEDAICCIEWADRVEGLLPPADLYCYLNIYRQGRQLKLTAASDRGYKLINVIS